MEQGLIVVEILGWSRVKGGLEQNWIYLVGGGLKILGWSRV